MNLLSRVLVLVCLAVWQLPGVAQGGTDVDAQIQAHRQWVEAHVPHPDTLSQRQLFIEAANAIKSNCHEDGYIDLIRAAGEQLGIAQLTEYAQLRQQRGIDVDDQLARTCLRLMGETSAKLLGKADFATAYLYLCQVECLAECDEQEQWIEALYDAARRLYGKDRSEANEEIWLLAQFIKDTGGLFHLHEVPLSYEQCRLSSTELIKFYIHTHRVSDVAVYAYQHLAAFTAQAYEGYYAYINRQLAVRGDSILSGKYDGSALLGPDVERAGEMDFWDGAVVIASRLLHPGHPDVVWLKLCCSFQHLFDPGMADDVRWFQSYSQAYWGQNSLESAMAGMLSKSFKIWSQDYSVTSCDPELAIMRQYFSPTSSALLSQLSQAMTILTSGGQLFQAVVLRDEVCDIVARKYAEDPVSQMGYRTLDWFFQKSFVAGHTTVYDEVVQEVIDYSASHASFEAMGLCKDLIAAAQDMLNDQATALKLQRALLVMCDRLVGKKHPLFANEYVQYGRMAAVAYPVPVTTLDGKGDARALFDDIVKTYKSACDEPNFGLLVAGNYHYAQGDMVQAHSSYLQFVDGVERGHRSGQTMALDDYNTRYYLAGAYAFLLDASSGDIALNANIDDYGQKLVQLVEQGFSYDPYSNSNIYSAMVGYLMHRNRYAEAEAVLNQCMAYYDQNPNQMTDGHYMQIVQGLIELYGFFYSDMDKSLRLAQQLERNISQVQSYGNDESYIYALRSLYDLVESKTPYDFVMLNKYLRLLHQAVNNYYSTSKNEQVLYSHGVYVLTKYVYRITYEETYHAMAIANGQEADFLKTWPQYKQVVSDSIMPKLHEMKLQMEQDYPETFRQREAYHQIIQDLAIIAHRCLGDVRQAEDYYQLLVQCNEYRGKAALGDFYIAIKDWNKASEIFSQIDEMVSNGELDWQVKPVELSYLYYSRIFSAYYHTGKYDLALKAARKYYQSVQARIQKNFDLFTEAERESFIQDYGSGGVPLEMLLPHRLELAPEVYDVMLREKGLLLRSSERLRKSILASAGDTIMQAVDSLRAIQLQIERLCQEGTMTNDRMIDLRDRYDKWERYVLRATAQARRGQDTVPTWQQVRDCLKPGEACIEYVVTDSAVLALVLTPGVQAPHCVPLMGLDQMQRVARLLDGSHQQSMTRALYDNDTEHLYARLWQPLEPLLGQARDIYFSASGFLNAIAFAAIKSPDGQNLIDHYDLHQLTTTAMLVGRDSKPQSWHPRSAQIFGGIYYNDYQREDYESQMVQLRAGAQSAQLEAREVIDDAFPFLPNTVAECDRVARLMRDNRAQVDEKVGGEPTEDAVRAMDGHSPDIIHFSTHGFCVNNIEQARKVPFFKKFDNLNTMLCTGLVLAGGEDTWLGTQAMTAHDNLLCSYEIASLNLDNTQLVVLSACETGLGGFGTEGVYGLQRGFKQAGVKSICASLWSVNDHSTAQLMQAFYRHWMGGDCTMRQALKAAMLEQRAINPQPYYWAPFILLDAI